MLGACHSSALPETCELSVAPVSSVQIERPEAPVELIAYCHDRAAVMGGSQWALGSVPCGGALTCDANLALTGYRGDCRALPGVTASRCEGSSVEVPAEVDAVCEPPGVQGALAVAASRVCRGRGTGSDPGTARFMDLYVFGPGAVHCRSTLDRDRAEFEIELFGASDGSVDDEVTRAHCILPAFQECVTPYVLRVGEHVFDLDTLFDEGRCVELE